MFELPKLPFEKNALEPYMSRTTLDLHHGKHHLNYINTLNGLIEHTRFADKSLPEIIGTTAGVPEQTALFNNAAQTWNHGFFWKCLTPNGGGALPRGKFKDAVLNAFENEENFKSKLIETALSQFGSGWAWVVADKGEIRLLKTGNADTPVARGLKTLFAVDVWEHAYYPDYQNRRADYVQTLVDRLANWNFAAQNFTRDGAF